jgi:hypothetical protein
VGHSPREPPKEVNGAVHLSAHAEFLSMDRTSSLHFGAEILLASAQKMDLLSERLQVSFRTIRLSLVQRGRQDMPSSELAFRDPRAPRMEHIPHGQSP